jgi:tetratricopeptide (TPR) repeat protein
MQTRQIIFAASALWLVALGAQAGAIESDNVQAQLQHLLAQKSERSSDPAFLVRLSDVYLDVGDDVSLDIPKRTAAYEEGAKIADQAIQLQEQNADAHYLYAANLGSAAQLKGMMASTLTIQDLKRHVKWALELNPNHPAALHMMGMMLEELPWILGGDADGALAHLRRAVAADPSYAHARLDLAKAYLKRNDTVSARRELSIILRQSLATPASETDRRRRQEAANLLDSLGSPR